MNNKGTKIKIKVLPSENHSKAVEIPVKFSFKEPDFVFSLMIKSLVKFTAFILIVALNWAGLSAVIQTIAEFNDTEGSPQNIFVATTLNFSLRSGQSNFVPSEKVGNMKPGDSVARDIYIKKEGDLPFKYNAKSEPVENSCDLELYNALQLKIWYNWYDATPTEPNYHEHRHMDLKYDGLLKDFNLRVLNPDDPDLQIPNPHPYFENVFYGPDEHWFYASEIILPEDVSAELQDKSCQFKFVFDGWQIDFPDSSSGYSDTEEILSTIATGNWTPDVTVTYPNGREVWHLVPGGPAWSYWCLAHGMNENCEYPIRWTAVNKIGLDTDLLIDIYFSTDSGVTWLPQIVDNTENDGVYWWRIPYNMSYVTDQARIKVEATHKDYSFLTNWDISNADFCPPMMTLDDLLNWQGPDEGSTVTEITITDAITATDTEATITEENSTTTEDNQQEEGIINQIDEVIDGVVDDIIEEIMTDEPAEETVEAPADDMIVEDAIIEPAPVEETLIIEQAPVIEEQAVIAPDNNSAEPPAGE